MKEVDRRHAYSLITAWSFLRRRRADPNRDPKAERSGKHRRGADGIIRPSPAVFVGYMVWLMTLPMVSAAERFIPSVA